MFTTRQIILASASARRTRLLKQLGIDHRCLAVDIDESHRPPESAIRYVERLAVAKAVRAHQEFEIGSSPVLAADTAIDLDGDILGKPDGRDDAGRMLSLLSGRDHQVFTAVALLHVSGQEVRVDRSVVKFGTMSDEDIENYLATGEYIDKAGAYAIQGFAAAFVERIEGSYSGVMGLPLFLVVRMLRDSGLLRKG